MGIVLGIGLWIIHVLAVEGHDIVEHTLGLDSRAVGVKFYGSYVAVDGFMPLALLTVLVTFLIPLFCGHNFQMRNEE